MMRRWFPLVLVSILSLGAVRAQNWALLNPAYKYNYSNDGSDTISNQIFVTHIDTLGVDSFRYELNRIGVVCLGCATGLTPLCNEIGGWGSALRVDSGQFMGRSVTITHDLWVFGMNSELVVHPNAGPGATWICPSGAIGSVILCDTMAVLDQVDSVKRIGYSTGDTLLWSKASGVVSFHSQTNDQVRPILKGIGGGLTIGAQLPTVFTLFNYNVSDVLQYYIQGDWTDGFGVYFTDGHVKYEFLERISFPDSVVYSARIVSAIEQTCYGIQTWQPCGTTWTRTADTIVFTMKDNDKMGGNPFNPYWERGLWPGSVGKVSYPVEWCGIKALAQMRLNSEGGYIVEQSGFDPDPFGNSHTLYSSSVEDTALFLFSGGVTYGATFTNGIGLTRESLYYFEGGQNRTLEGRILNGAQAGSITPDGVLLDVASIHPEPPFRLFPNPASDQITVRCVNDLRMHWGIKTLTGQWIQSGSIQDPGPKTINVSALPAGSYLLELTTPSGRGTELFVIAR